MDFSSTNNSDVDVSTSYTSSIADFQSFCYEYESDNGNNESDDNKSPTKFSNSWIDELSSYFKLSNLLNGMRTVYEQKHDITISNTIMNSIIDKKLGTVTYHSYNKISKKAYHTYDYPEIYYNKKLYNNCDEWIKNEFPNKEIP